PCWLESYISLRVVIWLRYKQSGIPPCTATGVEAELEIAKEKSKPYFLLAAYPDKTCTKPKNALSTDKVYKWTWDNLKLLIGGSR
ncbi:hypothetical protein ACNPKZ_22545, partial [Shewanella algae]